MNQTRIGGRVAATALLLLSIAMAGCDRLHEARAQKLRRSVFEHFDRGERQKAFELSEVVLQLGVDDSDLRGFRGGFYLTNRQPVKALSEYDAALAFLEEQGGEDAIYAPWHIIHMGRAGSFQLLERFDEALESYEKAAEVDDTFAMAHNNIAWMLATLPVDTIRDGKRAIEAAERACELTDWENYAYLDTLAAAYAEAGNFEEAVKWQKKAAELCDPSDPHFEDFEERIRLYESGKPFREDPNADE